VEVASEPFDKFKFLGATQDELDELKKVLSKKIK
tara:strand:+ start:522 stop:623 length:102 start_codon:yes stop_codon:yes gene_type:complete